MTTKPIVELELNCYWAEGGQRAAGGAWPLRFGRLGQREVFVVLITCGQEARGSSLRNEGFSTSH